MIELIKKSSYREKLYWCIFKKKVENLHKYEIFFRSRFLRHPASGALITFVALFFFFSFTSSKFLTLSNFRTVLTVSTELGIIAIGITFLMIAGEFDLSVGSVFGFSILMCTLLANTGLNSILASIVTLGIAAFIGFINGMITLKIRIPSFITTLGMSMFFRGIMLAVSRGTIVSYSGDHYLSSWLNTDIIMFRLSNFIFVGLVIVSTIMLNSTRTGTWIFATGGNKEIARAVGVNVSKVKLLCFILSGVAAGFSGLVCLSRFGIADVLLGTGMELEAITATVIGGTLLTGGRGSIMGAFLGALSIGMMRSGLILMGVSAFWYRAFIGIILIIVVAINTFIVRQT